VKLALFLPNWIGDAAMATPALRAIRAEFSQAEIVGVMRPVIADTLAGAGFFDRMLLVNPRGANRDHRGWRFVRQLRAERCDTAVLFPNSLRSAWWAWCSGAKRRIGFSRDGRGWLLTDRLTPRDKSTPHPVLEEYNRLAAHLGCRSVTKTLSLAVSRSDEQALASFWSRHPLNSRSRGVVCFNTGGAFGPAKNWPREYFAKLAQRVVDELGLSVLVLCGPAEREDARWIVSAAARPKVLSLAEQPLSVGLTKAAIKHSQLLVTTDSGPRHFAAAFDVPVVTLFGPTHIAWSETSYPRAVHLQIPVDCGPCQQRVCPLGHHRCLRDLSVDQVFRSLRSLAVSGLATRNDARPLTASERRATGDAA
jgi:heptosyltransferase-2